MCPFGAMHVVGSTSSRLACVDLLPVDDYMYDLTMTLRWIQHLKSCKGSITRWLNVALVCASCSTCTSTNNEMPMNFE